MSFRSQKSRLVAVALVLTLLSGSLLIWISYWNTRDVGSALDIAAKRSAAQHAERQIAARLNAIGSIVQQLESTDYIDYARENNNLRSPEEARQNREALMERLEKLQLPAELIDQIYFIGTNVNQSNFGKIIAGGTPADEREIPWIEDLERADLLKAFTRTYNMPAYIMPGAFTSRIRSVSGLSEEQRGRLDLFFRRLEGNLVINNGVNNLNVLTVVVINPALFAQMMPSGDSRNGYMGVADSGYNMIWSNLPDGEFMNQALERMKSGAASWRPDTGDILEVRRETISPYGVNLLFFEQKTEDAIWNRTLLRQCAILLGITLLISLAVSSPLAGIILRPYNVLARISQKKENDADLRPIPERRFRELPLSKLTIRSKVLLLLTASVMLPFTAAVVLHGLFVYQKVFDQSVDSTVFASDQIVRELRSRMDSYEHLANGIAVDSRLSNLYVSRGYGVKSGDEFPVIYFNGIGEVAYFALYNSQGAARYSSVFVNNLTLFKFPLADAELSGSLKPEQLLWIAGPKDVYNHAPLMLIKKLALQYPSEKVPQDAYLQVVLQEDTFQSVVTDRKTSFVILDERDRPIYANTLEPVFTQAVSEDTGAVSSLSGQTKIAKLAGSNLVQAKRDIPGTGWKMLLFFNIDDLYLKANEMFYRYLLLVGLTMLVISGLVWVISAYLVRPVERLKAALENGEPFGGEALGAAARQDEIGLLVRSFNDMVVRINDLMEENIRKQVREKDLLASKMKAELGMLQQQINPHFLYNTLEAINMRARQYGATDVSAMVNSLAKIFRFTISTGTQTVPLSEEIQHVANYLTIQSIRFKHAFALEWDVDEDALPVSVLKFILQPIVENALQHGMEGMSEQSVLRIGAKRTLPDLLQLQVYDNGFGMSESALRELRRSLQEDSGAHETPGGRSGGVGLKNVYQRLRIYYGEPFEMTIESEEFEGTVVTLRIPIGGLPEGGG